MYNCLLSKKLQMVDSLISLAIIFAFQNLFFGLLTLLLCIITVYIEQKKWMRIENVVLTLKWIQEN